jgi:hypothetical protein
MGPEVSLPYSLEPFTGPHPEPDISTIDNQKHEQQIRCRKIAPYEITSIYNTLLMVCRGQNI